MDRQTIEQLDRIEQKIDILIQLITQENEETRIETRED